MSKSTRVWAQAHLAKALAAYKGESARDIAVALTDALPAVLAHTDVTQPGKAAHALQASVDAYVALKERLGRKTVMRLYAERHFASPAAFAWSRISGFQAVACDTNAPTGAGRAPVSFHDLLVVLQAELATPLSHGVAVVAWNEDPPRMLAVARTLIACIRQMNTRSTLYRVTGDRLLNSKAIKVEPCSRAFLESGTTRLQGRIGDLHVTEAELDSYVHAKAAADAIGRRLKASL